MATVAIADLHKVGSSWFFVVTRALGDVPVDLTGLTIRSMFREGSVTGRIIATLTEDAGIDVSAAEGQVTLTISPTQSATVTPGSKVFFDVEMTDAEGQVWQSDTYKFKTEAQVTTDDD